MNNNQYRDDELDAILKETGRSSSDERRDARVNLEQRERVSRDTTYFSLESLESTAVKDDLGATRIIEEDDEDDVRIFEGSTSKVSNDMDATRAIPVQNTPEAEAPEDEDGDGEEPTPRKGKNSEALGCLKSIVYVFVVLVIASVLAVYIAKAAVDVTGIGRSTMSVDVTVPEGATTTDIAELLESEDVIEEPLFFRLYCRLMHVDASFHPGVHTVSSNMGYSGLVSELQRVATRETVTVMIPEGSTIDEIATLLADHDVCTSKEFYTALVTVSYDDYEFIQEIPQTDRADRVYLLEGYLFPDTYEFYVNGAAETVIRTMLDNFDSRINADTRAAIKASGKTLDQVIIEASILHKEAGKVEDMSRVMRVIQNRLNNTAEFPRLQLDSTEDYLLNLMPSSGAGAALDTAYNTYVREGLPVGAICNPGLDAINAALNPSQEEDIVNCYYFASIVETGETAFFETFAAHEAWCREHGVGMYG